MKAMKQGVIVMLGVIMGMLVETFQSIRTMAEPCCNNKTFLRSDVSGQQLTERLQQQQQRWQSNHANTELLQHDAG